MPRGIEAPKGAERGSRQMTEKASLLVVDDEPKIRALLAEFLGAEGYRVTTSCVMRGRKCTRRIGA